METLTTDGTLNKIQQGLKAPKGQMNSFGGYKYRSCEDILEAVKPLLGSAVLTITDEIVAIGDRFYVKATATLLEQSGKVWTVSALARESQDKKGMDAAQITGATSSYARKYALNGLFCIDDTKDADTQDNTQKQAQTKPQDALKAETYEVAFNAAELGVKAFKLGSKFKQAVITLPKGQVVTTQNEVLAKELSDAQKLGLNVILAFRETAQDDFELDGFKVVPTKALI